jgi:hypothetical protein
VEDVIPEPIKFEWDKGILDKSLKKHGETNEEAEEVFFDKSILVAEDVKHSTKVEKRYQALGKTDEGRSLFVGFTVRNRTIRIISVRSQSRRERKMYEK